MLLGGHVTHGGGVAESLGLHDPLHVGGPAILRGDDAAGRGDKPRADHHLLHLLVQDVLHHLAQTLELLLVSLPLLLLLLVLGQLETLLGDGDKVLAVKLLELLYHVLVNGLSHVHNLQSPLLQPLDKSRGGHDLLALPGDVVDVFLVLLHPGHVVTQGAELVTAGRGVVAEVAGELLPVGGVLVDAKLQILAELLVELLEIVLVLGQLLDQLQNLLNQILSDDLEDLVLLEHFSGDVEGEILRVNNTLGKVKVLRNELLTVVHDEDTSDIELDVVLTLLVLEEVEGGSLGDEQKSPELQLTLNGEMFNCEVLLPVIGEGLVELSILLAGNVVRRPCPDGLGLVKLLILSVFLLDGFLFLLVLVFLVGLVIRSNILNLRLVVLFLLISFLLLLVSLIIADLLAPLLLDQESDGVSDELRVLLDNLLDLLLLEELSLVFLHMKNDLGTSAHWLSSVSPDGERSSSG